MKKRFLIFSAIVLMLCFCLPMTVAAQLLDKDAIPPVVASSGSFETTYQTHLDFSLDGGTLTDAAWTVIQYFSGYTLTGTGKTGELISLALTGIQSPVPDTNPSADLVFNNLTMVLSFRDAGHNIIGEEVRYSSGNVKTSPLSYQLEGVIPAGAKTAVISGSFKCRWATSVVAEETVSVTVELEIEEEPAVVVPAETGTVPTSTPENTEPQTTPIPSNETSDGGPLQHAGPLATAGIALIAALAAILAGSIGQTPGSAAANSIPEESKDPAYEKAKIPDYPRYVTGQEGETLSKMPNGNIEITYPNGEIGIHFPNGTAQVRTIDGSTWVENPDGTVAEKTAKGLTIIRNQEMDVLSVSDEKGITTTRHPEEPDAFVVTSPYGGSVVMRTTQEWTLQQTPEGRHSRTLVERQVLEGTIRTEDMTLTYKPDGSVDGQHDNGSRFSQDSEGNVKIAGADGSEYEEFADGRFNLQGADGSYINGNAATGELDAKMTDGSFWKRDANGNGSFDDREAGKKGTCQSDGSARIENDSASTTRHADGTMEFRTTNGVVVVEKPDGTVSTQLPDGRSSLDTPDGAKNISMPDGTVFQTAPGGQTQITRPDGSVTQTTPVEHENELARYNDRYNSLLKNRLN